MSGLLTGTALAVPAASDPATIAATSNYGFLAFLALFFLALCLWLLVRSMNKHLRKIRFNARAAAAEPGSGGKPAGGGPGTD